MTTQPIHPFITAMDGTFIGLLSWEDFDHFWDLLLRMYSTDWFVYQVGEAVPVSPLPEDEFRRVANELAHTLKQEHQEDYCGIVYVDDKKNPSLIKVYNPKNLGKVCGFSDQPPLPGWILSHLPPIELTRTGDIKTEPWWRRLMIALKNNRDPV